MNRSQQPVIVGGGPAGAVAALRLAHAGSAPLLFERSAAPHDVICGEFLSAEAVAQLLALGVDVTRVGSVPIDRVEVAAGIRSVQTVLPFVAQSVRRRDLDAMLLEAAAARGAEVVRGVRVTRVTEHVAETPTGDVAASAVMLATGKHAMHGQPQREGGGGADAFVGFKQYYRATPALARALDRTVRVVMFEGGYAGVQLVSRDTINLCLVVTRSSLGRDGGSWEGVQARLMQEPALVAIVEAEPLLPRPLTISGVPYGFLAKARPEDGIFRLGDQAAVIPSFCGDGMAIAMYSGVLAADAVKAGHSASDFQRQLLDATRRPVQIAMRVQRIAQHSVGRMALMTGLAAWPRALRLLARMTRMPNPSS